MSTAQRVSRGFHRIVGTIILIGGALLVPYLAPRFFNLSESAPADPIVVLALSCLFGDDEVAEIGSLFRGSFSPEDE